MQTQRLDKKISILEKAINSKRAVRFDYIDTESKHTYGRFIYPQEFIESYRKVTGVKIKDSGIPSLQQFIIDRMSNVAIFDKDNTVKETIIGKVQKIVETESFLELYKINISMTGHEDAIKKAETGMQAITEKVATELNKM